MRTLTGKISCSKAERKINENALVKVSLIDCSIACAPSKTLASFGVKGLTHFPVEFELHYDEKLVENNMAGYYAIQVRIETNEKLNYINDTRFLITNIERTQILDHIDMHVIPVGE
jgi:uncharacterized lipoprotein YbaY